MNDEGQLFADEIVVGCNIASLRFAEENNIPVVYTGQDFPNFFEKDSIEDFTELCFHLSLLGLLPFGDLPDSMRIDVDLQVLSVFCGSKRYNVFYEKIFIFSDKGIQGLPEPTKKNKKFKVLDWLDLSSSTEEGEAIYSDSDFVKNIYFYPSLRNSRKGFADAVAVSFLSEEELNDPNMCDSYARLKSINLMSSAGILGTKMGSGRHRPLKVSHSHREIIPVDKNEYEELPNIEFR